MNEEFLTNQIQQLNQELKEQRNAITELRIEVSKIQTKASIFGAVVGALASFASMVVGKLL